MQIWRSDSPATVAPSLGARSHRRHPPANQSCIAVGSGACRRPLLFAIKTRRRLRCRNTCPVGNNGPQRRRCNAARGAERTSSSPARAEALGLLLGDHVRWHSSGDLQVDSRRCPFGYDRSTCRVVDRTDVTIAVHLDNDATTRPAARGSNRYDELPSPTNTAFHFSSVG